MRRPWRIPAEVVESLSQGRQSAVPPACKMGQQDGPSVTARGCPGPDSSLPGGEREQAGRTQVLAVPEHRRRHTRDTADSWTWSAALGATQPWKVGPGFPNAPFLSKLNWASFLSFEMDVARLPHWDFSDSAERV